MADVSITIRKLNSEGGETTINLTGVVPDESLNDVSLDIINVLSQEVSKPPVQAPKEDTPQP